MYIPNVASPIIKDVFIFESYKKKIRFVKRISYSLERLKKKRFVFACKRTNKKYLILVMLKNTINHI